MIYAIGYATKTGMIIKSADGGVIRIKARPFGKLPAPDPGDFRVKFLDKLEPGDIALVCAGPSQNYIEACAARARVHWVHTGRAEGVSPKAIPDWLLKNFEKNPDIFYKFLARGGDMAILRGFLEELLVLRRTALGAQNAQSQHLRRQVELLEFFPPDKDKFVADFVEERLRLHKAEMKGLGVSFTVDQESVLRQNLATSAEEEYELVVGVNHSAKVVANVVEARLEASGLNDLYASAERKLKKHLLQMPEVELFDGLLGAGAVHTMAQVLAYMRDPRLYPTFGHLASYAGVGMSDGQARQRRRGSAHKGHPEFHKVLCFDFPAKYWMTDPIGFFRPLYYAIKAHQYYLYWDLILLTRDVYAAFGYTDAEDEESWQDERGKSGEPPIADGEKEKKSRAKKENSPGSEQILAVAERLEKLMHHMPLLAGNSELRRRLEELKKNPDPKLLWQIFSRSNGEENDGNGKGGKPKGLNLAMTPKRIEQQVKRMLGIILLRSVYYRWLGMLGAPLPLAADKMYVKQWQLVTDKSGLPDSYDHIITLAYYRARAEELRAQLTVPLPPVMEFKFVEPADRLEWLEKQPQEMREAVWSGLTEAELKKYGPGVLEQFGRGGE